MLFAFRAIRPVFPQNTQFLKWLAVMLFSLSFLLPDSVAAAQVTGLYRVEVPVSGQGDSERKKAENRAMAQVLVKVTGQRDTLSDPAIKAALRQSTSYVQGYSYRREDTDEGRVLLLVVGFDEAAINQLLRISGLGIWGGNRPTTLMWLAMEQGGRREIKRSSATTPLSEDLNQRFARRGLLLVFPLMDFEDELALSPVDVWGLFTDKLTSASARYGSESILAGRLSVSTGVDGEIYNGRLLLLFRNQRHDVEVTDLNSADLARVMADLVGNTLSRHYAVTSGGQSGNPVLEVAGIGSTRDYAGVIRYLEGLTAVRNVAVRKVNGSLVELELSIDGTTSQLVDSIALERMLVRNTEASASSAETSLKYRWRGR